MEKRMDLLQSFVRYLSHCFKITPFIEMTPSSPCAIAIPLRISKLEIIIARNKSGGYDTLNSAFCHYCKFGGIKNIGNNRSGMSSDSCCYFRP